MSNISTYNLELQEQANALGFSTTQEALEAGFEVRDGNLCPSNSRSPLEAVLSGLDEVLAYVKTNAESDRFTSAKMISHLRRAERFLIDHYKDLEGTHGR